MKHLNWLHFTDLHSGLTEQEWLWPTFRKRLFDDLRRLYDSGVGPWDVVLFSGDLTQSATQEQFSKLTEILESIWEYLNSIRCSPLFLSVPGNHDLIRPASTNSVVRTLSHWHQDKEIRELFWSSGSNEYRQMITDCFANYSSWWQTLTLPKPKIINAGLLPGDFSAIVEKSGIRLGVVGLNTAFLQLTAEDYEGHLEIHEKQLLAVCNNDPDAWSDQLDIALLVTHHGFDWLHSNAQSTFLSEVYPPGRFFSHIHGHLHKPSVLNFSKGGAEERRYRQGPSLFGLKSWGAEGRERIHGYTAGQFELSGLAGVERLWPRRLVQKMGGHWRLDPDISYDLNESNCIVTSFQLRNSLQEADSSDEGICLTDDETETQCLEEQSGPASEGENFGIDASVLSDSLDEESARKKLAKVPRLKLKAEPQHLHIRQVEQAHFESLILRDHCTWLVYDWGLAKENFIACVVERLSRQSNTEVFRLLCDDVDDFEELEPHVIKQFGLTLQEFCIYASQLSSTILVIDEIPPGLIQPDSQSRTVFDRITSSILDFCPDMYLILASRQSPTDSVYGSVQLRPLDISEVANYISKHPKAGHDLFNMSVVDDLYMRSDGLPMHLDRLIETLQVASLKELVDLEMDIPLSAIEFSEPIPKALKEAVATISQSTDRYTRRSFSMLKVLSLLPEGETLQAIRRVYPTEPFYPQNAMELVGLSLLKVETHAIDNADVRTSRLIDRLSQTVEDKRLCVPRQVRDYVNSMLTSEERMQIVRSSADLLFGEKWREGSIRLCRAKTLGVRGARSTGPGNEHSVTLQLLRDAIQRKDEKDIIRVLMLAIGYCQRLKESCRYKDACIAADEIISLIEGKGLDEQYVELAIIRGQSLRMIGQRDAALEILKTVLERDRNFLSKKRLGDVYLSIALIHESNHNSNEAIEAAQMVQKFASKTSAKFMHAESIKVGFKEEPERGNLLKDLEKKARKKGYTVVANNIALDLARTSSNADEKSVLLESVLGNSDDPYNRIRAVIDKANLLAINNNTSGLGSRDRQILNFAYSFLFAQRMTTLFSKCHKAIWRVLKAEANVLQLLKVFRLSSFVWRIRGEDSQERKYLEDIRDIDVSDARKHRDGHILTDINYFDRRMQQVFAGP